MALTDTMSMAFARPGGETCPPSQARPIDLGHLARQTMGDRAMEQDVLAMFVQQALLVLERLAGAKPEERARLAHSLKGSARGIGAFAVADCAEAIERDPNAPRLTKALAEKIKEARDFIAAINR